MKNFSLILLITLVGLTVSCKNKNIKKVGDTTIETKIELGKVHNVSVADFQKAIKMEGANLVDIRTLEEYMIDHIEGATMIDWEKRTFQNYVLNLPLDQPIVIYCRSGNRSGKATASLQSLGFKEIYNLEKGIKQWRKEGLTLTKEDTQINKDFQEKIKTTTNDVEAAIAKVNNGGSKIYHVNSTKFKTKMDEGITIVDIRTPAEFKNEHIAGVTELVDWNERTFKAGIEKFDKNKPILIYCRSGNRSGKAASAMQAMGFKEVYNLEKGIKDWKVNKFPVTKAEKK